jgi:hypothetical protein
MIGRRASRAGGQAKETEDQSPGPGTCGAARPTRPGRRETIMKSCSLRLRQGRCAQYGRSISRCWRYHDPHPHGAQRRERKGNPVVISDAPPVPSPLHITTTHHLQPKFSYDRIMVRCLLNSGWLSYDKALLQIVFHQLTSENIIQSCIGQGRR